MQGPITFSLNHRVGGVCSIWHIILIIPGVNGNASRHRVQKDFAA